MENSTAYNIGQIVGAILASLLMISVFVFFIIAVIKAVKTRRKGWILTASLFSIPFLFFLLLVLIGVVVGFRKGFQHSTEIAAARRGDASQLLTAAMTPVFGAGLPYEISLPWLSSWSKNNSHPPFDYFFAYHDAYIGVIAEGIGMGTPERICDIAQKNLATKASEYSVTTPAAIIIDAQTWLTYDATATINGIKIKYRFYVYADANYTFQIITWTGPVLFDRYAPVFDRVAKSFKLPK